jgi:hypothetical protein
MTAGEAMNQERRACWLSHPPFFVHIFDFKEEVLAY